MKGGAAWEDERRTGKVKRTNGASFSVPIQMWRGLINSFLFFRLLHFKEEVFDFLWLDKEHLMVRNEEKEEGKFVDFVTFLSLEDFSSKIF